MQRKHCRPQRPALDAKRFPDLFDVVGKGRNKTQHHGCRQKNAKRKFHPFQRQKQVFDTRGESKRHHHVHHGKAAQKRNQKHFGVQPPEPRHPTLKTQSAKRRNSHHRCHQGIQNGDQTGALEQQHINKRDGKNHELRQHAGRCNGQQRRCRRHSKFGAGVELSQHARLSRPISEQSPHVAAPLPFYGQTTVRREIPDSR